MVFRTLAVWAALCVSALAQLEVAPRSLVVDAKNPTIIDGALYVDETTQTKFENGFFSVQTEAANIEIEVEDKNREPVEFDEVKPRELYRISKPGKYWVEVTAVDFDKRIWGKKKVIVNVGTVKPDEPNPPDDPVDPVEPTDVPEDEFNNFARRVRAAAVKMNTEDRQKYSALYQSVVDKMTPKPNVGIELKTAGAIIAYLQRNKITPNDLASVQAMQMILVEESQKRTSFEEIQRFYQLAALGVGL